MNSISNQILASIFITIIVVFGGWGFIEIENKTKYEAQRMTENQERIAERLAFTLAYPLWNLNDFGIKTDIQNEALDENVQSIQVFDEYGQPYMGVFRNSNTNRLKTVESSSPDLFRGLKNEAISRNIIFNEKNIGKVVVYRDPKPLEMLFKELRFNLLGKLLFLSMAVAVVLFLVLRKVVIKPLLALKNGVSAIKPGQNVASPQLFHITEIDSLQHSFLKMANDLLSSHNEILDKNTRLKESESRIKSISNNLTNGMIYQVITRLDGYRRFTYLSESVQQLYGITAEEGMKDADLVYGKIHPDDLEAMIDAEKDAIKSFTTFKKENRMKGPSGEYRWSSFVSTPKLLDDGSVCWDGIEFVITEQKQIEQDLRLSQQKFALSFNSSPDVILITEVGTGLIIECNDAVMDILGYDRGEVLGKTTLELNIFKNLEDRQKIYTLMQEEGHIRNLEILGRSKYGAELIGQISVERGELKERSIFITTIHDITELKRVENELRNLVRDKDRFMSILGHDLRSPVAAVVGILDILGTDFNDLGKEEVEELLKMAQTSANNASELLDDVLLWATNQSGRMNFEPQRFKLNEMCNQVTSMLQSNADAKDIALHADLKEDCEVFADKNMLNSILRNLISNALKFTKKGGNVDIAVEKESDKTVISVSDNGMGIQQEDMAKLFDRSQLFTSTGTANEKGTGFGLKLCQEFVENHGGEIWVDSEVGKGTTFHFSLPDSVIQQV